MIDLCQWRARIGSWSFCQWSKSRDCATGIAKGASGTSFRSTSRSTLIVTSIFILIALLLFISGDVELNPGPTLTGKLNYS